MYDDAVGIKSNGKTLLGNEINRRTELFPWEKKLTETWSGLREEGGMRVEGNDVS